MDQNGFAVVGIALGFVCVVLVGVIAIAVLYLLTLQKALNLCGRRNRTMEPAKVWLNLIPLFGLYWGFHTVINIGNSLKNEFVDRDLDDGSDYGKTIGIWAMSINIASSVFSQVSQAARFEPGMLIAAPFSIAALVLFIIYWVRIAGYNKHLTQDNLRDGEYDDDRDDADDRPRRPLPGPKSTDIKTNNKDDRFS